MNWPPDCARLMRMTTKQMSTIKADKRQQAQCEFQKLIESACVRGFHGSASVTICVQDGHIQYTRIAVERMVK